nr:SOS response-associated peptidase [Virgibacillus sp. NKC19-3]
MPMILPKNKEDEWLTPYQPSSEQALEFLQRMEDNELTAYNIGTYVNDETCVELIIQGN